MCRHIFFVLFICFLKGETLTIIKGDINKIISDDLINIRTCPDYVDSCIYICNDASINPCHPENLFPIAIDTSGTEESTDGSRYRIFFPWEYNGMNADKFIVTASWPCLSPTAVYASGNYAYWDIYGNDECPGTVQGSIWYGEDCEDENGIIGSENCQELVGRFCFVPGDTLNWSENADQNISTDFCGACWMSEPAWSYYDTGLYSDSLLFPEVCDVYDHCHHSAPDSILCGVGYMDEVDTTSVFIKEKHNILENYSITNYPNPFNTSTNISYEIYNTNYISIAIYDLNGNNIKSLVNKIKPPGKYLIEWNGENRYGLPVSAGMYIYTLSIGEYTQTKKMILLK